MTRKQDPAAKELSDSLRSHRREIAEVFAAALQPTAKWAPMMAARGADWASFVQSEFFAFVDYLAEYFRCNDPTFRQLFVGEKIKSLYDASLDDEGRRAQARAVSEREFQGLAEVLRPRVSDGAWALLETELGAIDRLLSADAPRTQRVLLVGDCLFLDIVPFIVSDLLEHGIKFLPDYATSKNPLELRDQLRRLSQKKFDVVFFSPFSYEFSPTYTQLNDWRKAGLDSGALARIVDETWRDTRDTLDLLADLFDCPIHVHNSSAVIREQNAVKRLIKLKATARVRHTARARVNERLAAHVEQKNAESYKHLFVLDELAIVERAGEQQAGAFHYRTALQHPALLGCLLADSYLDILVVNACLAKKKLVVCDLDNTLWEGVIGEGEVSHHHDRQRALKALKAKGVVLAINSKNDPEKVHWRGGTLCEDDFVCAQISWDPKVQGMKRIQSDLNLKMKDFVFIDDRDDELELMRMTHPEVLCLDAKQPRTWTRIALWHALLDDDLEMDRTLMYKQRDQRKAFIQDDVSNDEEKAALFAALQLKLTIMRAQAGDLKRVVELINRTNQFNLEGHRTSFKEVSQWHASREHIIVVGQTADRFGDMGTTCVAVAQMTGGEMRLLPFVLSCRVFGYGIERSVLNYLKSVAASAGIRRIVGRYVPTPHNGPCKDFLAENGFRDEGQQWVFEVGAPSPSDAQWLQVEVAVA